MKQLSGYAETYTFRKRNLNFNCQVIRLHSLIHHKEQVELHKPRGLRHFDIP